MEMLGAGSGFELIYTRDQNTGDLTSPVTRYIHGAICMPPMYTWRDWGENVCLSPRLGSGGLEPPVALGSLAPPTPVARCHLRTLFGLLLDSCQD